MLPCPPPGDLTDPGIKPGSLVLQADSLLSEPPGKPCTQPVVPIKFKLLSEISIYSAGSCAC